MDLIIDQVDGLRGTLIAPPSKSYGQRALAASLLLDTISIHNLGDSEDELAVKNILKSLGSNFSVNDDLCHITNSFDFNSDVHLHSGESGLCARLFSSFFILNKGKTNIQGKGTLMNRPFSNLEYVYKQLDVDYLWNSGRLPIALKGSRIEKNLEIDGSLSSQFITGLLYYLVGLRSKKTLELKIHEPTSIPYIDMTIELLNSIGASIRWLDRSTISVSPSHLKSNAEINVEGCWSSAAFWIVAAAINGDIRIEGLNIHSLQPDRTILDIVRKFGANVSFTNDVLHIKSNQKKFIHFDASHCPDIIPILAVLAVFGTQESTIYGTDRLVHKESNRLNSIQMLLDLFHISFKIGKNYVKIFPLRNFNIEEVHTDFIEINSCQDHRMAMSSAILASNLMKTKLLNSEVVVKSYPQFYQDLQNLEGNIYFC